MRSREGEGWSVGVTCDDRGCGGEEKAVVGVRSDGEGNRVWVGGELAGVGMAKPVGVRGLVVFGGGGERKKLFELETELVRVCKDDSRLVAGLLGGGSGVSGAPLGEEGRTLVIVAGVEVMVEDVDDEEEAWCEAASTRWTVPRDAPTGWSRLRSGADAYE